MFDLVCVKVLGHTSPSMTAPLSTTQSNSPSGAAVVRFGW